jgi:hypothetical protein
MSSRVQELEKCAKLDHHKKFKKIVIDSVASDDKSILETLYKIIKSINTNGLILAEATKAYVRLKRNDLNDCLPIFELWDIDNVTVQESLLDVLGYDRVVPSAVEQELIIIKYFKFGDNTDYRYFTDPRYGLAAACALWKQETVSAFLKKCITINDAPLKYVAENSLKGKTSKLR